MCCPYDHQDISSLYRYITYVYTTCTISIRDTLTSIDDEGKLICLGLTAELPPENSQPTFHVRIYDINAFVMVCKVCGRV